MATRDAEREAEWFQTKLAEICNVAMRVRHSSRNVTYWWSPELDSKRWDCVLAWRKLQHAKRRNTRHKVSEEQLRLRYRETVISLQRGIREAKSRVWSELIATISIMIRGAAPTG